MDHVGKGEAVVTFAFSGCRAGRDCRAGLRLPSVCTQGLEPSPSVSAGKNTKEDTEQILIP